MLNRARRNRALYSMPEVRALRRLVERRHEAKHRRVQLIVASATFSKRTLRVPLEPRACIGCTAPRCRPRAARGTLISVSWPQRLSSVNWTHSDFQPGATSHEPQRETFQLQPERRCVSHALRAIASAILTTA